MTDLIEFTHPFFEIKTFGRFPVREDRDVISFLRPVFGPGEYVKTEDFDSAYDRQNKGLVLHYRTLKGWDYYIIASSIENALEAYKERISEKEHT